MIISHTKKYFLLPLTLLFILCSSGSEIKKKKLLLFFKTAKFHHNSIAEGKLAIMRLAAANNFQIDTTTDSSLFTYKNLKPYQAVIFLNTTGDVLNDKQQAAFEKYIRSGKGFLGIHAAADTEYDWPWYGRLVGAYFSSHPAVQQAAIDVLDSNHPATRHLPKRWERKDEWYNYKNISNEVTVLMTLDETSYTGKQMGNTHPICWYQSFEGGRSFYTGLGHTKESFTTDSLYLQHLLGGIKYVTGVK